MCYVVLFCVALFCVMVNCGELYGMRLRGLALYIMLYCIGVASAGVGLHCTVSDIGLEWI